MSFLWQRVTNTAVGADVMSGDGPWRAKTVWLALLAIFAGLGLWLRTASSSDPAWDFSRPLPKYVYLAASYIGGFCIGWAFRRFIRLALVLGIVALVLVSFGKYAGWNLTPMETKVKTGATWVRSEASTAKDYLQGLLPSVSAGAVGAFLGWRRKGRVSAPPAAPLVS